MAKLVCVLGCIVCCLLILFCDAFCTSEVYCKGGLLDTIQMARLYNDSKTFVDMPMKYPPSVVLDAFSKLPKNASASELLEFLGDYFGDAGDEVVEHEPEDWVPNPPFLSSIRDETLRSWGKAVNEKWKILSRRFEHSESCPDCYSSINSSYPFIVAGNRFREYYYWDGLWIIEGLLVSNMQITTKYMILNYLEMIDRFGFIPNGARIYYLNRSQPPLLTQMIENYFEQTNDIPLLKRALPSLDNEYKFWLTNRSVEIEVRNSKSRRSDFRFVLTRFSVDNNLPRPESYWNDMETASGLDKQRQAWLWGELASGAESGWDFSSRWFEGELKLINVSMIVPVDLNAIMYANEMSLMRFHTMVGSKEKAEYYKEQANQRLKGVMRILWNKQELQWFDFNLTGLNQCEDRPNRTNCFVLDPSTVYDHQHKIFYPSNFVPLWSGCHDLDNTTLETLVQTMNLSQVFNYPAGIPASSLNSSQQWDFPNGWAPSQYFVLEGLTSVAKSYNIPAAKQLSYELSSRWLQTTYCAWNRTGFLFEKYDVTRVGSIGGGGEYTVQRGFGWTNGFCLYLLNKYGPILDQNITVCPPEADLQSLQTNLL